MHQIPAQITVTKPPAVTDSRNKLLAAMGAEAQYAAEKSAGQAPAALVELARAYALVTSSRDALLSQEDKGASFRDCGPHGERAFCSVL
ncbi:hypothetical protein [Streptomyces alboniger]|uniref:Uncharacterized protein n=1 Tax=Streptomyces alboniger TaxID=132473 RepID=A0A5J6HD58_STRAD|nr:hypothetical protein [Streptomyces alboniger]QEV16184.1 hypothetical protein CP975_00400 [Streptomyces alboniger]